MIWDSDTANCGWIELMRITMLFRGRSKSESLHKIWIDHFRSYTSDLRKRANRICFSLSAGSPRSTALTQTSYYTFIQSCLNTMAKDNCKTQWMIDSILHSCTLDDELCTKSFRKLQDVKVAVQEFDLLIVPTYIGIFNPAWEVSRRIAT